MVGEITSELMLGREVGWELDWVSLVRFPQVGFG